MSISRFNTEQYTDKSITSAKLADDISIVSLTAPLIVNGNYKLVQGDGLTKNGSTLDSTNGYIFKYINSDLAHLDENGNLYIKGNVEMGGTLNSIVTTVNAIEVADSEIILNAGVASPYAGGAQITVDRGGVNYNAYLAWDEVNHYWKLYDGANTARLIDQTYGDTRYSTLASANTFSSDITVGSTVRAANSFIRVLSSDAYNAGFEAYGAAQGTGYCYVGQDANYGGGIFYNGSLVPVFATGEASDRVSFYRRTAGSSSVVLSYAHNSDDVTFVGDILVSGNKVSFGNGSYISNKSDTSLDIYGDGTIQIYGTSAAPSSYLSIDTNGLHCTKTGDSYGKIMLDSVNGKIGFGPGSSLRDAWIYRDASNSLKTDGALNVIGNIATNGTFSLLETGTMPTYYTTLQSGDITGEANITVTFPTTSGTLVTTGVTSLSSLSAVGTISSGTWQGTAIGILYGGTGATTKTAAFDALSPLSSLGDTIYYNGTDNVRLAGNITGTKQFLSQTGNGSVSAEPAWFAITKADIGLSSVENQALSLWNGTTNITTIGAVTATSVNKVTITAPATSATLTIANTKTFTCNASITLAGTDAKTLTMSNSLTLAGVDGKTLTLNNNIGLSGNDGAVLNIGAGGTLGSAAYVNNLDSMYFTETEIKDSMQGIRNTQLLAGGTLAWRVVANTFSWSNIMYIFTYNGIPMPGNAAKLLQINIAAGSALIDESWKCAYITIPATDNQTVTVTVGTYSDAALANDKIIIATRDGDGNLIMRNGIFLSPGASMVSGLNDRYAITSHTTNASTYGYGDTTNAGHLRVGTGISVSTGTISVAYGVTNVTACVGNDVRLSDARTPVAHGDSVHNHQKFARITYTGGTSNIGYQWTHGLNSANVIFSITADSPETHVYYTVVDNNNVKIYLDDAPYETIILDVVATVPSALTSATANLTT